MVSVSAIQLGAGLSLPADFVTQTCGIIARKGAGKTHTGVVLAEELLNLDAQVVVVDPLGVWWGLRSSHNGASKGFQIVVFGGDHADLPLSAEMGPALAEAIVQRGLSAVLSLDHLSKNDQRRFVTGFSEALYQRKGPQEQRTPLHLILDEADMFAPQRVPSGDERMLGAIDTLVRRGRVRGFGVTMITQRPATIHKDVFTQIEVLITLQLTSPQDRKAVDEWVQAYDDGNHRAEYMASLAALKRGEAWVWSPSWLQCFQRIQVRQRKTFDSSRTPTAGARQVAPKAMAEVDLEQLRADLADAVEQVKASDPATLKRTVAALKARITELERELERAPRTPSGEQIQSAYQKGYDEAWHAIDQPLTQAREAVDAIVHARRRPSKQIAVAAPRPIPPSSVSAASQLPPSQTTDDVSIGSGERAILMVLAQAGRPRSCAFVGLQSGYAATGGTFLTYLSRLRKKGLVEGRGDAIAITPAGQRVVGPIAPILTVQGRIAFWREQIGDGERKILEVLIEDYPQAVAKDALGSRSGYEASGGTFLTYLSRLRTRGLVEGRDELRAAAELMEPT